MGKDLMKLISPAEYVIKALGGVRATARAIGRDPASVVAWKRPRAKKGTDGQIPDKCHHTILKIAQERGLDITPNDLILGRMGDE